MIANPGSGSGDAGEVEEMLRAEGAEVLRYSPEQVSEAIASRPRRVVVAGGDGSIAPVAAAAGESGIPLAVIPVGTANDFARAMEIPLQAEAACRIAAHGQATRRLDLGRVDDRPFVNIVSAGLAPAAAERARGLKRLLGPVAYTVGALQAGLNARPLPCRVSCDDAEIFSGSAWQVTCAITGAFGGGAGIEADPADAALDVAVIEAGPRVKLIRRAFGLRRGTIGAQRGVITRRCRSARLDVAPATDLNADGELLSAGPVDLEVEPRAFELVVA